MNRKLRRNIISERVKFELEHCSLSPKEIAEKMGVYQSLISEYKSGKKVPSTVAISMLCEVIGADANYVLGIKDI